MGHKIKVELNWVDENISIEKIQELEEYLFENYESVEYDGEKQIEIISNVSYRFELLDLLNNLNLDFDITANLYYLERDPDESKEWKSHKEDQ